MKFNIKDSNILLKLSGILKAPPKLLTKIEDWAVSYYCGEVLKNLNKIPNNIKIREETSKKLLTLRDSENYKKLKLFTENPELIKTLLPKTPGSSFHILINHFFKDATDSTGLLGTYESKSAFKPLLFISIDRLKNNLYNYQFYYNGKGPGAPRIEEDGIIKHLQTNLPLLKSVIDDFEDFGRSFKVYDKTKIKELKETMFWCKHFSKITASKEQAFEVDLLELPYFNNKDMKRLIKDEAPFISAKFLTTKEEKESYGANINWNGLWTGDLIIYANIPNYIEFDNLNNKIQHIKNTVRHELQHMIQTYMEKAKKLNDIGGLPSKKIREMNVDPYGNALQSTQGDSDRLQHELQDIEFYTNLKDSVENFKELIKFYPLNLHKDFFDMWIDKITMEDFNNKTKSSGLNEINIEKIISFYEANKSSVDHYRRQFALYKKKNFAKYMKAIKEFYKEVAYLI